MKETKNNTFIISAPSGAGKSTLIQRLLSEVPSLFFSVSHTTRPPRDGEKDGVDYFFVNEKSFRDMIDANQFLEWAQVHGHYYGTSRMMLERSSGEQKDLILDVDIQGAESIRKVLPETVSIFILPPSNDALKHRLERRQKDSDEQIAKRIRNAYDEIQRWEDYDYIIINADLDAAYENLAAVIKSMRCRKEKIREKVQNIVKSFRL